MSSTTGWSTARIINTTRDWLTPALLRRRTFSIAAASCVLAVLYWGAIASDRYVSEAHIIVQKTDLGGASLDFSSILSGASAGGRTDLLLLRDHLLGMDMLTRLDQKLDLRAHFSNDSYDLLSRMWSKEVPQEWFHRYYRSMTSIEMDEYSGVLIIKAQAYSPKVAHAITAMLVEEGERAINDMAHQLAQDQVKFLEQQVASRGEATLLARQDVIAFQNRKQMVSPQATAENLQGNINQLSSRRIELQAKRSALLGYLTPQAPGIVELDLQLKAIDTQINREQARLTAPTGKTLNRDIEEFQRLQMTAEFADNAYKTALMALEKGHVEATRTLKKVITLQSPTLPQYPEEPRRSYNILVFILIAGLLAGIVHLIAAIIRDHKD